MTKAVHAGGELLTVGQIIPRQLTTAARHTSFHVASTVVSLAMPPPKPLGVCDDALHHRIFLGAESVKKRHKHANAQKQKLNA